MQQLTMVGGDGLEWHDVAAPRLEGPGEALVRPLAVARCDIDINYATGLLPTPRSFAIGHECIGEIRELGGGVAGFHVGQRVIAPFQISCGRCRRCQRGHTGSCEGVPFLSAYGMPISEREWGGALSDVIRVPFAAAMLGGAIRVAPASWLGAAVAGGASRRTRHGGRGYG